MFLPPWCRSFRGAFLIAVVAAGALLPVRQSHGAGHVRIEQAWIRTAPPGTMMLAGYAILRNDGDAAVEITSASSPAFGDVSIHESVIEDGIARMHPLDVLRLPPGGRIELAPGGKHLMLMDAVAPLGLGAGAPVSFRLADGSSIAAQFVVRDDAPAPRD